MKNHTCYYRLGTGSEQFVSLPKKQTNKIHSNMCDKERDFID